MLQNRYILGKTKVSQEIKSVLMKLLDKGGLVVVMSDECAVI